MLRTFALLFSLAFAANLYGQTPAKPITAAQVAAKKMTVITAIPYVISTPGTYVLLGNLVAPLLLDDDSALISINAPTGKVVLNMNGFTIDAYGQPNSAVSGTCIGIQTSNVTVENGTISNFLDGIDASNVQGTGINIHNVTFYDDWVRALDFVGVSGANVSDCTFIGGEIWAIDDVDSQTGNAYSNCSFTGFEFPLDFTLLSDFYLNSFSTGPSPQTPVASATSANAAPETITAAKVAAKKMIVITELPYTITVPGTYVLMGNLNAPQLSTAPLILINAPTGKVVLNMNGFSIGQAGQPSSQTSGAIEVQSSYVTIENGTISNFGIEVTGQYDERTPSDSIDLVGINIHNVTLGGLDLLAVNGANISGCTFIDAVVSEAGTQTGNSFTNCSFKGGATFQIMWFDFEPFTLNSFSTRPLPASKTLN